MWCVVGLRCAVRVFVGVRVGLCRCEGCLLVGPVSGRVTEGVSEWRTKRAHVIAFQHDSGKG